MIDVLNSEIQTEKRWETVFAEDLVFVDDTHEKDKMKSDTVAGETRESRPG